MIAIEERNLPLALATGSERQKLAYFEPLLADLEETITFHVQQPQDTPAARDLALTTLLQRKGRIFDALADNIITFRGRATAADRELLDRLSRVTSELAKTALSESTRSPVPERQRTMTRLAAERERLEMEVQRRSAGYLGPSRLLTLSDVQSALPPNAALIEFARYRPFDPAAPVEGEKRFGAARYVAYVMRRNNEPQWKDLGEADAVDKTVERFRGALASPSRDDVRQRSAELHRLLIAPLKGSFGDATHLLISPDGALNLIPFEALRDGPRYLVEDHLISYLTSGRDLVRMATPRPASRGFVVFADPDFGQQDEEQSSSRVDRPGHSFPRLAATVGEAQRIVNIFPEATVRSGDQATEAALKALRAPRVLHIATHGFFRADAGIENPLLRSGPRPGECQSAARWQRRWHCHGVGSGQSRSVGH